MKRNTEQVLLYVAVAVWAALITVLLSAWLEKSAQESTDTTPLQDVLEPQEMDVAAVYEAETEEPAMHREAMTFFPVPLDHDLQAHIIRTCEDNGIDPAVVVAMIATESNFKPGAIGDGGESYGLMQIHPKWHGERMERLGVTDLLNPEQNVTVGMDYLAELLEKYSLESALTAYNSGSPGEGAYSRKVLLYMEALYEETQIPGL